MSFKVLVTIPWFKDRPAPEFARLREHGCEILINDKERAYSQTELIEIIPGISATIAGSEPYNEQTLAAADSLRVIARVGVGYDMIDVPAATRRGVPVAMAFGTNHEAVADHAFALLAALCNQLPAYDREVKDGRWGAHFHRSLWRGTVGIIGLGRIGRALARRCAGFEMRILAHDIAPDAAYAAAHGIEMVDLDRLLRESDFVSVNAPHTDLTDKMINTERLSLMKPGAYLVNTARGGLVDEPALIEALSCRKIAGAGLDVVAVEPLPADSPLCRLDNVLLTPHCAGVSDKAVSLMLDRCIDSVLAIKEGRKPERHLLLNPEVLD
ncbi:MAG: phosphoglycerate dehydrogenase [Alphaproteobacteria bacterium]